MDAPKLTGFELIEPLGRGGMGVVWKARQLSLDRLVAIKLVDPATATDPDDLERILTEARAAARLKHPGIVQVYDVCEEQGLRYLVMEYVAGYSVGAWLRRKGVIEEKDALAVAQFVADALQYAWVSAGLVHCDIKPDNIMVDADGSIKVADLGLSHVAGARLRPGAQSDVLGTPSYMSPEQITGDVELDCRTDIYSLGATLYHMVTGRRLFHDLPDTEVMERQLTDQVPDPREINPAVSAAMSALIERMLIKNRHDRYADWPLVQRDLRRVSRGLPPAGPPPPEGASTVKRARTSVFRKGVERLGTQRGVSSAGFRRSFLVTVLVVTVLLAAWYVWWHREEFGFAGPRSSGPGPGGGAAEEVAEPPAAGEREAALAYEEARRWSQVHPDDYEEATAHFKRVTERWPGTQAALLAHREMRLLRERREAAISETAQRLEESARELMSQGQYAEAATMLETYSGAWAFETASNRLALAGECRKHLAEQERSRMAEQAWNGLVDALVGEVAEGRIGPALERVNGAAALPSLAPFHSRVAELQALLTAAGTVEDRIAESFRGQIGSRVTLDRVQGAITVIIKGVSGRRIQAELPEGGAQIEIGVEQFSVAERLRRLASDGSSEAALVKGALALKLGDYAGAKAQFQKTSPLLAEALVRMVAAREPAGGDGPVLAALQKVMQAGGISVPSGEYDEAAWLAAIEGAKLKPDTRTALDTALKDFLKAHARSPFGLRATPVILALQRLAQEELATETPAPVEPPEEKIPEDRSAWVAVDPGPLAEQLRARNPNLRLDEVSFRGTRSGRILEIEIVSDALRDLGPLGQFGEFRVLTCRMPDGGEAQLDLAPLRGTQVTELTLEGYVAKDLGVLRGTTLKVLRLPRGRLASLAPLKGLPLTELDVSGTEVKDLEPLRGMKLEVLRVDGTKIASLQALAGMPLRMLSARNTAVREIQSLRGLPLRWLALANNRIFDYQPLRELALEYLDLSGTMIHDLAVCERMPLKELLLKGTRVTDVSKLRSLTNLETLDLSNTEVRDLSPLARLPLRKLDLSGTKLSSREMTPLKELPLAELNLANTQVAGLQFLAGLRLAVLDIENTPVRDLSPLKGMPLRVLRCRDSRVQDLTPLKGMPLRELTCNGQQWDHQSVLNTLRDLETVNGEPYRLRRGD